MIIGQEPVLHPAWKRRSAPVLAALRRGPMSWPDLRMWRMGTPGLTAYGLVQVLAFLEGAGQAYTRGKGLSLVWVAT